MMDKKWDILWHPFGAVSYQNGDSMEFVLVISGSIFLNINIAMRYGVGQQI